MDEYETEKKATELANTTPGFVTINEKGQEKKLFLDFVGLMPLHSPEEYFGLATDIVLNKGCIEPIKVWHDVDRDRVVLVPDSIA